jgi:ABC-2 type transport system ATP-binding protein
VLQESHTDRQTSLLVRSNGHLYDARWSVGEVGLEEVVLAYLTRASHGEVAGPVELGAAS